MMLDFTKLPMFVDMDRVVGVIQSTNSVGEDARLMVKEWRGRDGHITFGIHIGDGRWVETEVKPEAALQVVSMILTKPSVRALLEQPETTPAPEDVVPSDTDIILTDLQKQMLQQDKFHLDSWSSPASHEAADDLVDNGLYTVFEGGDSQYTAINYTITEAGRAKRAEL